MKIRTLLGLTVIGTAVYAHKANGGEFSVRSMKDSLQRLWMGVRGKAGELEARVTEATGQKPNDQKPNDQKPNDQSKHTQGSQNQSSQNPGSQNQGSQNQGNQADPDRKGNTDHARPAIKSAPPVAPTPPRDARGRVIGAPDLIPETPRNGIDEDGRNDPNGSMPGGLGRVR